MSRAKWSLREYRSYFDGLAKSLGIRDLKDWYSIRLKTLHKLGNARSVIEDFKDLPTALQKIYPELTWHRWLFLQVPKGYWTSKNNCQRYLDWLGKQFGVAQLDDWYNLKTAQIQKVDKGLILQYGGSFHKALKAAYPDHDWQPWRFHRTERGYWNDQENVKQFMEWLSKQLNIQEVGEWTTVPVSEISRHGGSQLLSQYGGKWGLLNVVYPQWTEYLQSENPKTSIKTQILLFKTLKEIFPSTEVLMNELHPSLKYKKTGAPMELDIYVPSLSLAFEYQGEQHYQPSVAQHTVGEQIKRDSEKKEGCQKLGITLVEIPYWWDQTKDSLIATIHSIRPDILI